MGIMVVQDIDRPDVGGVAPKMTEICDRAKETIDIGIPVMNIGTDDNICSTVHVWGAMNPREEWTNAIYYNSLHFSFMLRPEKHQRYYDGGNVTVELCTRSHKLAKFRKSTTTPEKAIQRILKWLKENCSG